MSRDEYSHVMKCIESYAAFTGHSTSCPPLDCIAVFSDYPDVKDDKKPLVTKILQNQIYASYQQLVLETPGLIVPAAENIHAFLVPGRLRDNHPYCLHLWRPKGVNVLRPESIMVGFKWLTSTSNRSGWRYLSSSWYLFGFFMKPGESTRQDLYDTCII